MRYFLKEQFENAFLEGAVFNYALCSASFGFIIIKLLIVILSLHTRLYGLMVKAVD